MLKQQVEVKTTQQMILSPFLREELKILQLQNLNLLDRIDIELMENPALEEEGSRLDSFSSTDGGKDASAYTAEDMDWEKFFEHGKDYSSERFSSGEDIEYEPLIATEIPSLPQFLVNQLQLEHLSHKEISIGEMLISYIDEDDGYFKGAIDEVAAITSATPEEVEHVLSVIQTFEPTGVGARDIIECLNIQIQELGVNDSCLSEIVNKYFEEVKENNFDFIAEKLNASKEHVLKMIEFLKKLEPKPARIYSCPSPKYVIPDIIMSREGSITVNNSFIPSLKISSYCQVLLKNNKLTKEEKEYIKEKLNKAVEFMKALENRGSTLQVICKTIFEHQHNFLPHGEKGLNPLTLSDVSKKVQLHESTISRSVSNKYVKTPLGTFPLKYFFISGVKDNEGTRVSSLNIKTKIHDLIKEEGNKPLNDGEIEYLLMKDGITVARRTIAKYREELGIPSASKRKKIK
ncbi:MAG: RNA polymerase factor sigma-54 [bacterium]|nr:RNA polymerase factor sigma-54 [bacterium]